MSGLARLVLGGTACGLAVCALVAARAFASEWRALRPQREAVAKPTALAELATLEDVSFQAGRWRVRGWYQPSRNGATVILGHGSGADRRQLLPQAALLARHGYGVLLFDGPGHGESEGRLSGGEPEVKAFLAAAALAATRTQGGVLGAFGLSLGGCVALQAAAEDARLRAVVVESTPADLRESLRYEHRAWGPLAYWPARLAHACAGFELETLRPSAAATRLGARPLLVISGDGDPVIPVSAARRLAAAGGERSELWVVPAAGHGDALARQPAEYERRLAGFYEKALRSSALSAGANRPAR